MGFPFYLTTPSFLGATHKKEWDAFMRAVQSKSRFPADLAPFYQTNRTELFNFWVDSGKSWSECKLKVQRSVEARNVATKGWKAVQGKELRKRFEDEAKFKKLVESRKQSGLFYEDADFPNDDDETRFDIRYINLWVLFG